MKATLPRYVTLVSKVYFGNASVVKLVKVGPKYYHTTHVWKDPETGEEQEREQVGAPFKSEKDRYVLLEGKRWDMQNTLRKLSHEHDNAKRTHEYNREQAKRECIAKWDRDNEYPRLPQIEELVNGLLLQGL